MSHKITDIQIEQLRDLRQKFLDDYGVSESDVLSDEEKGEYILVEYESGSPAEEDYSITTKEVYLPTLADIAHETPSASASE